MSNETMGIEHLLAAAIVAAGGALTIKSSDVQSPEINGKYISLDLNDDETITMRLVDYDG